MSVTIVEIPKGEDGRNQGIDDYLAAGGALEELDYFPYTGEALPPRDWPVLADEALHGLAGRVVRKIKPNTEADPVALLLVFLTAYGNAIGRGSYFKIGDDKHFMKIFTLLVGRSSKARKGVAQARINNLMENVYREWTISSEATGLASGEGLTHRVRDKVTKKIDDKKTGEKRTVVVDEGVTDKRLLVEEPEFAALLTVMSREGNNLSMQVRKAWDDATLQNLTRKASEKATESHISIVAHTNQGELSAHLTHEKLGGGLINRFLPILVRRWQILPLGGKPDLFSKEEVKELRSAVNFGRKGGEIPLSADTEEEYNVSAEELWCAVYEELSGEVPGLLGEATARAEAYTRRLATIYALLDESPKVRVDHLFAALALWAYVYDSCRILFAGKVGDPLSDEILDALRDAGEAGLALSEIHELFSNHKRASQIRAALTKMEREGWVRSAKEKSGKAGRPTIRWWACDV